MMVDSPWPRTSYTQTGESFQPVAPRLALRRRGVLACRVHLASSRAEHRRVRSAWSPARFTQRSAVSRRTRPMKRATEMIQNARPTRALLSLFKMDCPRTIDRYIDYFGAAASPVRAEAAGGQAWLAALARARAGGRHGSLAV